METLDNEPDKHLKRQSPFTSDSELDESDLSESCGENSNESDTFKRLEAEHKIIIKPDPKLEKHTLSQKRKGETDPTLGKKQKMTNDSLSNDNVSNDVIKVKMEMEESEDNDDEADEADEMKGFESDSNIMNIKLENHELNSDPVSETKSLNISDIISTGNLDLEKSVELSDIIDTSELSQDKSDSVQNDFMDQSNLDSSDEMKASTSKNDDDIDFDITEKLREMGEISVKPVKKGDSLLKRNESEDEVSVEIARKPADGDDEDGLSAAERKVGNLRRNIREVMDDQQLDAATLSAQRQEMERLARVQEQQRIIREVQRQIALNRQNNKTQTRVISLLQGNTSILKQGSGSGSGQRVSIPGTGTVLVKLPGKGAVKSAHDKLRTGTANITPSVSIAPVKAVAKPRTSEQGESSESESEEEVPTVPIKKGKKDVVQVVDSSSDDDCIMLSDDGEPDEEPEEDTQNSGLHVNDSYNIPDDQGRVVINIGHTETEEDIYLAPQISRVIKPHQVGGVRFLFDNIIESVERFDTSTGFGCILAHSMGLGKTLQLVCFCDIFLRHTSAKTVLCIMPINTLQNWMAEFNMWLPVESAIDASPHKLHGEVRPRNFNLHVLNDSHKTLGARAKVVQDWTRDGGVLLIGYELYRLLSLKKMSKKKKRRGKAPASSEAEDPEDQEANRKLLDEMHEALVKPGPDLVICDEGHRIKNSHASISLALKQIRSKRRIVLTGYPLQNNLQEYWCMVDFVRPNYLGTKTEFANMFERPIQNGQCIDSTPQDIRLMRYRAHVLHSLLVGFVQRRSHAVLQTSLPQKEEYVLLVRMTPFQRKLYDVFMNDVVRTKTVPNPLKAFAVCCKIWNHTDVLYHFLKKREAVDLDLDLEDGPDISPGTESEKGKRASPKKGRGRGGGNCKNSKKDKKGNSSQVQPFAPVCVGSKPAATITPNSSSAVIEEVATESSSSQSVFNTLQEQQKPGDMNVNPNDEMIPNEINTANDQKVPPEYPMQGNDQNYSYNNMPYQQYSQNSYYNQPLKDEYRNPQYGNPIQQYGGDGYNPYPQQGMTTYGPQQNYWNNQSSYYPNNLDYNNWNPDYTNNMYGGHSNTFDQQRPQENSYDNRYTGFENIKNEEIKHWGSENTPTYIKPEELKTDDVSKEEADPKLEDEKEDILELQPCVPPKANTCISTSDIIKKVSDDPDTVDSKNDTVDNDVKDKDVNDESDSVKDKDSFQADYQAVKIPSKEEAIPYDWAIELMKGYVAGIIENSAKMEIFFCILEESIKLGDRILVFSQSLFTLNLIEDFLHKNTVHGTEIHWAKNTNYYRLDGSTSALEREKLINEFNCNPNIHMFLVSTRAGSLGINLVGANRVIVFDASWNPCHDTQAVCRVYRYGQKKPCFVYRLVMDNCLEKKIYDRQINKQGMADRVVDECNPDAHLSMKEVTNLCWDDEQDSELSDFSQFKDKYRDSIMRKVVESHSHTLSKEPFQHESLLIDRKEKKLSQAEKRLAQRGYELEKKNASRPTYSYSSGTGLQYRTVRTPDGAIVHRPVASVRPMQADMGDRAGARQGGARPTRWIPAEVWQRQGMTAQEMTLPLDVVIPTSSAEKSNIVLKAGQKVMVLKSPKGIYMQLESGKIIAIRTAFKVGQGDTAKDGAQSTGPKKGIARSNLTKITAGPNLPGNLKNNTSITVIPSKQNMGQKSLVSKTFHKKIPLPQGKVNIIRTVGTDKNIQLGMARPYSLNRGKLQVKSVTRSIGSIPGVTKPLDSDSLTPNLDPSIQSDVTRPKEEKASDAVTAAEETTDNSNLSANDNSNASIANEESVFSETPSSTPVGTPASEQSSKDEKEVKTFSESNKDEEIDHEPDEQNVKSNEFPSVEHKDSEQEENSKPDVNTTLESPKEVLSEDTLPTDTQSREKVIYKPHLVERRLKTTTQQKTSLKNYRHKSTHKRTLVSPSNATAAPTIPNMQESSLSRLEKTTSALGKEPNNRFQASLSNITRSYSPTNMEVPKYETTRPTQNALSKKVPTQKIPAPKFTNQNGDLDSEDSGRGTSSANSMRSTPATLTSLSDKSMDSFSGSNLQSSEPEKNAVNLDDKTSVISSNISTPNIPVGSPYDSSQQQSKPEVPYDSRNVGNEQFLNYGQPAADTNTNVPIAPAPPYPPYPGPGGCYPYPSNPPYEGMYPNYDPGYPPMFHGHSAFHRPEPLPVTVPIPGQEINTPSGYPLHPYPPPPGPHPGPYPVTQNVPGTPVINPQYPHGPPQSYPLHQSHYAGQNPVPNYPQNMNPYPGFSGQPLPPYSQFGGHYPSAPVNQPAYNTRPMYTPPDYSGSGYGSSGYPPYPPQPTPNQWGQ